MGTLVPVMVAVQFTRESFRQRSGHMDKPVLYVRANLHRCMMRLFPFGVRGCAMNLVSLSIFMVKETTSMWITPQHPRVFSH